VVYKCIDCVDGCDEKGGGGGCHVGTTIVNGWDGKYGGGG